jgi:hypothetical protein
MFYLDISNSLPASAGSLGYTLESMISFFTNVNRVVPDAPPDSCAPVPTMQLWVALADVTVIVRLWALIAYDSPPILLGNVSCTVDDCDDGESCSAASLIWWQTFVAIASASDDWFCSRTTFSTAAKLTTTAIASPIAIVWLISSGIISADDC